MFETLASSDSAASLLFIPIAVFTIAGAAGVAFSRNIVYAAFSLLATFVGMVGLFAYLSAHFLAVVQLMVYVGGILVLILFAVMLTNKISEVRKSNPATNLLLGGVLLYTSSWFCWASFLALTGRQPVRNPTHLQPKRSVTHFWLTASFCLKLPAVVHQSFCRCS